MEIQELRERINGIDDEIRTLFEQRMETAAAIGAYKREHGLPVLDKGRERAILARLSAGLKEPMDGYTRQLFTHLFEMSRAYQAGLQPHTAPLSEKIRAALASSPRKLPAAARVACQGVEGAYSQIACDKLFSAANILFTPDFEGVVQAVSSGDCPYGVLPVENNIYGSVNAVYDLMQRYSVYIVRSIKVRISHMLAVCPGVQDGEITEIFSHEQAIGQCSEFLRRYPNVHITVCANTAMAARMVAQSGRRDAAAICSAEACGLYGLEQLHRDIQNSDNNYTRFICIARELQIFEGCSRVSLMFRTAHKPGALHEVLALIAARGLDVSKLESRPIAGHDFEFLFYLDINADCRDAHTLPLLEDLTACTEQLVFLGGYSEA